MQHNKFLFRLGAIVFIIFFAVSCKKELQTSETNNDTNSFKSSDLEQNDMVLTPAGPIKREFVVEIGEGRNLVIEKNHVYRTERFSLIKEKDLGSIDRSVKQNSNIKTKNKNADMSAAPANPNWISEATWTNTNGQPISFVTTTWTVPANPPINVNQTNFIFNGISNSTETDILQPVLQYGVSAAGGTSTTWRIANWYVWNDATGITHAAFTPLIQVNVGSNLTGVINLTGTRADGSRNYSCGFTGYNNVLNVIETNAAPGAGLPFPFIPLENHAYQTFEAYSSNGGIPPVSAYPGGNFVAMKNIAISTTAGNAVLNWIPDNQTYGSRTIVVSNASPNGEVHIYFRPTGPAPVITSLGRRPSGGAIGSIIINFTYSGEYPVTSFNVKVNNNSQGTTVTSNQLTSTSPIFGTPPNGTVAGNSLTVSIQAVYDNGSTGAFSNSVNMTY